MGTPLNWMLSGVTGKKAAHRGLRSRLVATTILAVAPFLGYGRPVYAACVLVTPPSTFECSGTDPDGQSILGITNADVSTTGAPPYVVQNGGLLIEGPGDQSFTDNHSSTSITNSNYYGRGLSVVSNDPGGPGSVTIYTDGTISGTAHGIYARNDGNGDVTITANGTVSGVDYGEDFAQNDGIYAKNFGNNLTITTGVGSTISGEHNAIDARNYGVGDLTINANGEHTSDEYEAVFARNFGSDLTITAGAQSVLDGATNGINAQNFGEDSLTITVDGQVAGRNYDGIRALNVNGSYYNPETEESYFGAADHLTITTTAGSSVVGQSNGIDARNFGSGDLTITADGYVSGYVNDAIFAVNTGGALTITTGDQSTVLGGGHGIGASNYGNGDLTIVANGLVHGYAEDGDGIHAYNYAGEGGSGRSLRITTGASSTILGADDGIQADNDGTGELRITADGIVTGYNGVGISAHNGYGYYFNPETEERTALTITTGAASVVTGAGYGIVASNRGNGSFTITANGEVAGYGADGINARNGDYEDGGGLSMTVTTGSDSTVTGYGDDGIEARQYGSGNLVIDIGGSVTGLGNEPPWFEDAGSFGIEAWQATQNAEDQTLITVESGGLVQGATGGISVITLNHNISITNEGTIRNLSAQSDDLAIRTFGVFDGDTHVTNDANLIGTVEFQAFDGEDTVDNDGFWNMAGGTSDFGGGEDDTLNNSSVLVAADDSSSAETTRINGLEFFNNNGGLISLLDGEAGDMLEMDGANGTYYYGDNGRLAVDAALGPGIIDPVDDRLSDQLLIHGQTEGTTTVHVNVVAANGANLDGIPVVRIDGPLDEGTHFNLNGPVSGGFFTWDMRFDDTNNWYELFTVTGNGSDQPVLGAGAFEFPAGFAATQDIWFQTIGTALHRQADLRSLLQGLSVTPVADYSEPVEPTPIGGAGAIMAPGFWFQGFGAYVARNDEQNGYDLDQKQTTYGGMAGFDFGTKEAFANAWLFGVFGGYIGSDLKFTATDTKWNFEGPTAGAYVTYLDNAFYADATVKADFLDIKINPDELASEADDSHTNAVNIGGLLDTGYRFGHAVFVEPQASLAVVDTEVDDVNIYGGTVKFDDDTSVRGRLGLRLGVEHTHTDNTVYSADVTGSVWENFTGGDSDVTIADTGLPDFGVSDNQESTYGDVSLGLSAANPDGWSSFVRGNYVFADDYEAWTGNAGVRFVW